LSDWVLEVTDAVLYFPDRPPKTQAWLTVPLHGDAAEPEDFSSLPFPAR